MPNLTLASAPITNADQLIIELVTPPDAPATILIRWPDQPTVGPPSRFDATVAARDAGAGRGACDADSDQGR